MLELGTEILKSESKPLDQVTIEEIFVSLWSTREDAPPDNTVSNQTILWAIELLKNLMENGSTLAQPEVKVLYYVIVEELDYMKTRAKETAERSLYKPQPTHRYTIQGPPPLELPESAFKALYRVGMSFDHKQSEWSGWHTPEMEEVAKLILQRQEQLI
tara:strand:- start:790 stop:1266 length:477 start_codon:yes stop_codon:yes gene_type:complete